jgi:hypothetical protein
MSDDDKGVPSLLENESRGGEVAQGGFTFQDGVLLAHVPEWLAHDGFAALVRESVGDTEVKFFAPGRGELLHLIEAKNHRVTPAEFWKEVQRFRRVDEGTKGQFRLFTLACTGLSDEVEAVVNALQRVRGPISFYGTASAVARNSLEDFTALVVGHGHTEEEARFLLDKVNVLRDFSPVQRYAEGLFQEGVARWLPAYAGLPLQAFRAVFAALLALVRSRVNQPITRLELKRTLRGAIDPALLPPLASVAIHTATEENVGQPSHLCFQWGDFFGGPERKYPPAAEWDQRVLGQLRLAKQWVLDNRSVRRVALHGERRLSTSVAIGAVFSAVAGFAIDLHHRGEVWATDAHPDPDTPAYPLTLSLENGTGDQLAVAVGIIKDVSGDVKSALRSLGLEGVPFLSLHGGGAVTSARQSNAVALAVKEAIRNQLTSGGAKKVHLFYAGPAHLALFFGHRLNAVVPIQCYEWTPRGYTATCVI